ncbi:MAG TPA: glycosyltransferase family 2 protein, partial [Deltaproteobacteria bacterium]|nr:glycosyltransferase family 2 protein [Deltaproteobacteria bacterium]
MHDSSQRGRSGRPLVSVIVRTKERPDLLREALASLAAQTYSPVEAVIVNDGGMDVAEIVDDFLSDIDHIRYIHQSENGGRACAANMGLQSAKGEWIGFLDDDDLYEHDALR